MKNTLALALSVFAAAPALADIDTICLGGGSTGNEQRVEIVHVDANLGSKSDKALLNGIKTDSTLQSVNGSIITFALQGSSHVFSLEYNQAEATAKLTGQGLDLKMFCSRQ